MRRIALSLLAALLVIAPVIAFASACGPKAKAAEAQAALNYAQCAKEKAALETDLNRDKLLAIAAECGFEDLPSAAAIVAAVFEDEKQARIDAANAAARDGGAP